MTLTHYLLPVWTAYVLATASPGPSNMAIMAVAMEQGRNRAIALVVGIVTGSMTWAVLAATGLSAILATYANAVHVIRVMGGAYLLYLAYKSAKSALTGSGTGLAASSTKRPENYSALYCRGLLLHLSNPKAIFVWISIMSLGVQPSAPALLLPTMLVGCIFLSIVIFGSYAVLFSSLPIVAIYQRARRWFEGAMAIFFGYAGLRLLLSRP